MSLPSAQPEPSSNYWNQAIESLPQEALKQIQFQKLKKQMAYIYQNPYYQQRFKEAGAEPGDIKNWDDFRNLPTFLDKTSDRESQTASLIEQGHPYGLNLCAPLEKVVAVNSTSGTTGIPTFYAFTERDIAVQNEAFARGYWRVGLRPGDTVLIASGLSMWLGGMSVIRGLTAMGARAVPVGAEVGAHRILTYAKLTKPVAMVATPSIAIHLADRAPEILGHGIDQLGIKRIVVLGEPGAGLPEVRKRIEDAYGGRLYDGASGVWGLHSTACDAEEYYGLHLYSEDLFLGCDIIDPETRKPVPLTDGAMGEWVLTALEWEAAPAFRYAFGDLVQIFLEPCPHCGFQGLRFKIFGRTDDVLNVKGVKVYPAAIKDVINYFRPATTGEFRVVLSNPPPRVIPPLRIKVEHGEEVGGGEQLAALAKSIEDRMSSQLQVRPEITLVAPGVLPKDPARKAVFFEKNY